VNQNTINKFFGLIMIAWMPFYADASGFRIPESSIAGMSLSNAVVANNDTPGALIYNPALMSAHEERRTVTLGMMNFKLEAHVDPGVGNETDSEGNDSVRIPNFYYMSRVSPKWAWGLGVDTPFGLETTWPAGTFGTFQVSPSVAILEPETSKIEVINISPNASFKIDDHNFLAAGINFYDVRDLTFNTQGIEINGEGRAHGYTLAYYYQRSAWSFGATYRSSVKVDADGSIQDNGFAGGIKADASATLEFPSMYQIGIRNQVNNQVAVEFDIERTNWSSFDVLEIKHEHPAIPSPIRNTNQWDDTYAYRLGVSYQLNNAWQLRFGYTRDETPQSDNHFSARIPDADRQLYSAGFAYAVKDELEIEAGLMYVKFDDRTIDQPPGSFVSKLPGDTEANGTDAYNGKYESNALIIGVGFSATFDH